MVLGWLGQALGRHRAGTGQTQGRHWAGLEGMRWGGGRHWAGIGQAQGRHRAGIGQV